MNHFVGLWKTVVLLRIFSYQSQMGICSIPK